MQKKLFEFIIVSILAAFSIVGCSTNNGFNDYSNDDEITRFCYSLNNESFAPNNNISTIQLQDSIDWDSEYRLTKVGDDKVIEFYFTHNESQASDSDRARVQFNFYSLNSVTNFFLDTKFKLGESLDKYLDADTEFKWLNILELWVLPGWNDSSYPAKLHFSIIKNKGENFLTPEITSQYKNIDEEHWSVNWHKSLDYKIYPGKEYSFKFFSTISPVEHTWLTIKSEDGEVFSESIDKPIQNPYSPEAGSFWGVNPLKLYTGNSLLNSLKKEGVKLSISFKNPFFCVF